MNTFLADGLTHVLREYRASAYLAWCGTQRSFAVVDNDPRRIVTCLGCLASIEQPAQVGDMFRFEYPGEPQLDRILRATEVYGTGPDDLVFFEDGSHTKQKHIVFFEDGSHTKQKHIKNIRRITP